jgi:isoquinoline 1-oxidoreductase beta subunit
MVQAAAQTWNVDPETCKVENSAVVEVSSGKRLAFWELVDMAAKLKVSSEYQVKLKEAKDFRIIGKSIGRVDNPDIVTGKAVYGLDFRLPEMLYAAVARCPVMRGTAVGYDDELARAVPGVVEVLQVDGGVAVVAENTWAAFQGKKALVVEWDEGEASNLNSDQIEQELLAKVSDYTPPEGVLAGVYVFPYYAHATMEPMNCVADVKGDRCEVWVPTQNPQQAQRLAAAASGLSLAKVHVNVTLVGGAFGRRLEDGPGGGPPPCANYVAQAVQVSQAIGTPVQVVWTREDDLQNDLYHPFSVYRVFANLDDIRSLRVERFGSNARVQSGYWRSVTNPPEAFAHESFLDEYAVATQTDPVELRRRLLTQRAMTVVDLAASKAGWGSALPEGHGLGIAYHSTWGVTHMAQVAEVSVDANGNVRVQRVVCAIDCGLAINPDMVIAQVESGVVFGLTSTLKQEITIQNGRVQQSNFHDYPLLRFDEMPVIEVYIVPNDDLPTGVGEMANPPLAPAVTNAVYAATGVRLRRVPIRPADLVG